MNLETFLFSLFILYYILLFTRYSSRQYSELTATGAPRGASVFKKNGQTKIHTVTDGSISPRKRQGACVCTEWPPGAFAKFVLEVLVVPTCKTIVESVLDFIYKKKVRTLNVPAPQVTGPTKFEKLFNLRVCFAY